MNQLPACLLSMCWGARVRLDESPRGQFFDLLVEFCYYLRGSILTSVIPILTEIASVPVSALSMIASVPVSAIETTSLEDSTRGADHSFPNYVLGPFLLCLATSATSIFVTP